MTEYQFRNGIYRPIIDELFLYIDDGGLKAMDFEGYAGLLFDKFSHDELTEKLNDLYSKENVPQLHARDIKKRNVSKYERVYRAAFNILCDSIQRTQHRYIMSMLGSSMAIDDVKNDLDTLFTNVSSRVGNRSLASQHRSIYSHLVFHINDFLFRVSECGSEVKINTYIDRKYGFEKIKHEKFAMNGQLFEGDIALRMVINSYLKRNLSNNCRINTVNIVNAKKYPVLQLVDGLSNFSFNYAKVVIQGMSNSSVTEIMKFNVFKDFLTKTNSANSNEAEIKQNFQIQNDRLGYITDRAIIRWEIH